ncbi:MAG: ABC transporter ATP-binding protein [Clostridia bacterium]|nr:ABC transporter ATP-binding protein [Clostridia bacterium]
MASPIIKFADIEKTYGSERVLGPLSLEVMPGEIVGVIGDNGAGKSTLLRIAAGVELPDGGQVIRAELKPGELGYVPQELALYQSLTGRQNLNYWATAVGLGGKAKKQRCDELLELVNLQDKAKKPVSSYSGGMKRRMNLACALVGNVRLLLLDEPTVGADVPSTELMLAALMKLKADGCAVILVSHHMDEILRVSDRTVRLEAGKIIE